MKLRGEAVTKVKALNELIENTSELPLECQEYLLSLSKAMAFTASCFIKRLEQKEGIQSMVER